MSEHNHNSVLTLSLRITPTMNKPRFSDIARHLKEGITSGHYPVGTLLPTELELRDHYKTSRHTVRAALQELQQLGLVSRRKNVGTRVESATTVPPSDSLGVHAASPPSKPSQKSKLVLQSEGGTLPASPCAAAVPEISSAE